MTESLKTAQTRITAGQWRGRQVLTPRGRQLRPTTSLVRQALFDILGHSVVGAAIVDLYAGAGTVGFEALSRGAASVVFVERDRANAALMAATAERLGCEDRCQVVVAEVLVWLRRGPAELAGADLCFVDAPYHDDEVAAALELVAACAPARVVCEHHRARRLPQSLGRLEMVREATYGTTRLSFWQRDVDGGAGDR